MNLKLNIISVMNEMMNWLQSNLLTLNCNTTHFLVFDQKEIQIQTVSSNSLITNLIVLHFSV
jgi:hypothetical protein